MPPLFQDIPIPSLKPTYPQSGFFIQSHFGTKGNFELVVPMTNGSGFARFFRDNDIDGLPWRGPFIIDKTAEGNPVGKVDAISMIQANNFGTPGLGDLNVIVRSGDTLKLFWREDSGDLAWHGPYPLPGTGFGAPP